jgi:hypothetical protein
MQMRISSHRGAPKACGFQLTGTWVTPPRYKAQNALVDRSEKDRTRTENSEPSHVYRLFFSINLFMKDSHLCLGFIAVALFTHSISVLDIRLRDAQSRRWNLGYAAGAPRSSLGALYAHICDQRSRVIAFLGGNRRLQG